MVACVWKISAGLGSKSSCSLKFRLMSHCQRLGHASRELSGQAAASHVHCAALCFLDVCEPGCGRAVLPCIPQFADSEEMSDHEMFLNDSKLTLALRPSLLPSVTPTAPPVSHTNAFCPRSSLFLRKEIDTGVRLWCACVSC